MPIFVGFIFSNLSEYVFTCIVAGAIQVHQLYPELLKRLDDSCDDVRKAIVPALKSFFACAAPKRS